MSFAISNGQSTLLPPYLPSNGLIAWYPFNGNTNDESGNGNNGMNFGASLTNDRFGKANSAYSFNGINTFISIPHSAKFNLTLGQGFSISAWVKSKVLNRENTIISKGDGNGGNSNDVYIFSLLGSARRIGLELSIFPKAEWAYSKSFISEDDNEKWIFFVVKYNCNTQIATFYKNGRYDGETHFSFVPSDNGDTKDVYIGKQGSICSCNFFNGEIDDIGVWSRDLTNSEIMSLYNSEKTQNDSIKAEIIKKPSTETQITQRDIITGEKNNLAISRNGKFLASVSSSNNSIEVWDIENGTQIASKGISAYTTRSLCFSNNNEILAMGGVLEIGNARTEIRLMDLKTMRTFKYIRGHENGISFISFSKDDKKLISIDGQGIIKIWEFNSDSCLKTIYSVNKFENAKPDLSPDEKLIAIPENESSNYKIKIISIESVNIKPAELLGHTNTINSVKFSKNGKMLLSVSDDYSVRLWDIEKKIQIGKFIPSIFDRKIIYSNIDFFDDDRFAISAQRDSIVIWELPTFKKVKSINCNKSIRTYCLSPSIENTIAVSKEDGITSIFQIKNLFTQNKTTPIAKKGDFEMSKLTYSYSGNSLYKRLDEGYILWQKYYKTINYGLVNYLNETNSLEINMKEIELKRLVKLIVEKCELINTDINAPLFKSALEYLSKDANKFFKNETIESLTYKLCKANLKSFEEKNSNDLALFGISPINIVTYEEPPDPRFIPKRQGETDDLGDKYFCIATAYNKYELLLKDVGNIYELLLKDDGTSHKVYYKLYDSNGKLQKTVQGTWSFRDEGVYGPAYFLTLTWSGANIGMPNLRFFCQIDGYGQIQAIIDSQNRTWNKCF